MTHRMRSQRKRMQAVQSAMPAGRPRIFVIWTDDGSDMVTDDDGQEMTYAEYCRRHPDEPQTVIQVEYVNESKED